MTCRKRRDRLLLQRDCQSKESITCESQILHTDVPTPGDCSTENTFTIFHLPGKNCQEISTKTKKITESLNLQNDCVTKSSRCLKGRNSGFGATPRKKQNTHIPAVKSVNIVERGTHMPMHEVVEITYREKGGRLYEGQR